MNQADEEKLNVVRDYHERTKHRLDRYAASLGYMDWPNQPDPFRSFAGAEAIDLPHPELRATPTYDSLFSKSPRAAALDADLVGRLFYHSLALSAWKQAPQTRPWSLRINPSSGALYPTEGYLVSAAVPSLIDQPGVFHYDPFRHRLERRCRLSAQEWSELTKDIPSPCLLLGLTSIYWRESWKYGERAFRYCHHDVGHAIGAIAFSARALGWQARVLEAVAGEDLDRLLGAHLQSGIEAEHADCLLVLQPADAGRSEPFAAGFSPEEWRAWAPQAAFTGEPNRLSQDHHAWPVIEEISLATRSGPANPGTPPQGLYHILQALIPDRGRPAEGIIQQRRSARAMDGHSSLERAAFYQMLQRTLPAHFAFEALPWGPQVSLAIFVHRVKGLEPGLYLLARHEAHEITLREALRADFEWRTPAGCPPELRLYCLATGDVRQQAKTISCRQDIASDGAFSLGMLAAFEPALAAGGAPFYPRLFWECGLIGQALYLEAEAAGMRGTGIGCFLDDVVHEWLGIADRSWQSLYHFTVGAPVEDKRLKTFPPYAHLEYQDNSPNH
ncbi:MAG: SagB/ThcOx family dehydrogenase [Anaerolineales bacterium]|nr:SagB/ThcOx family dehydrogenase [Anaerolineales bacterium]